MTPLTQEQILGKLNNAVELINLAKDGISGMSSINEKIVGIIGDSEAINIYNINTMIGYPYNWECGHDFYSSEPISWDKNWISYHSSGPTWSSFWTWDNNNGCTRGGLHYHSPCIYSSDFIEKAFGRQNVVPCTHKIFDLERYSTANSARGMRGDWLVYEPPYIYEEYIGSWLLCDSCSHSDHREVLEERLYDAMANSNIEEYVLLSAIPWSSSNQPEWLYHRNYVQRFFNAAAKANKVVTLLDTTFYWASSNPEGFVKDKLRHIAFLKKWPNVKWVPVINLNNIDNCHNSNMYCDAFLTALLGKNKGEGYVFYIRGLCRYWTTLERNIIKLITTME